MKKEIFYQVYGLYSIPTLNQLTKKHFILGVSLYDSWFNNHINFYAKYDNGIYNFCYNGITISFFTLKAIKEHLKKLF
jgi:hypothetical protein